MSWRKAPKLGISYAGGSTLCKKCLEFPGVGVEGGGGGGGFQWGQKVVNQKQSSQPLSELRRCAKVEVAVLGLPARNNPYGFCGSKATLN